MRQALLAAALILVGSGCSKPEFYEMEPSAISFEVRGESQGVRAVAKNPRGQVFPKDRPTQWRSTDEAVATVDGDGKVTAVGPGRARIVAARGALVGEVMVDVNSVEKLEVAPREVSLKKDGDPTRPTVQILDFRGKPMLGRKVVSRCLDETICTMDRGHQIWPHNPGETEAEFVCDDQRELVKVVVK